MWVGPVENWIAALDQIVDLAPRTVLPGHGPATDLAGVREMRAYWEFIVGAVRERVGAGLEPQAAAREILRSREFAAQPFAGWDAPERIAINAAILARSDRGERGRVSEQERVRLLANMGELGAELG
jgi:glyoxylase-like metal-dependent hydrolase (beta-lactamase superfamily II)